MIKNIFRNLLSKKPDETVVKIEKVDPEDSGIDDLSINDDNDTKNVNLKNQINSVDVIALISEDEDDPLEISDDELPDVTSSGLTVVSESSSSGNLVSKVNSIMPVNNEQSLVDCNSMERVLNSDVSECQNLAEQNSTMSCLSCDKNTVDKSLVFIEGETQSIIQHQSSNTTITTTQKNQLYIINKPYIKPVQLESSVSKNECIQNTKLYIGVPAKKKGLPCIQDISNISTSSSNTFPKLLLFNPHSRVTTSVNGITSSTPVVTSEHTKSVESVRVNKINNSQAMKYSSSNASELISEKIEKNNADKIIKPPVILSTDQSTINQTKNLKKPSIQENNTKVVTSSTTQESEASQLPVDSSSVSPNSSQTADSAPKKSCPPPIISSNKKKDANDRASTSTINSGSEKTVPVVEKLKTSSIGVQTDPNPIPKNLKRKATNDISQDASTSTSHDQEAPPAKKQKIQSSSEASDVIIHLDGKSANRFEISNELLENGEERQIVSQFFNKISSVVIIQPPSTTQSIIKIINKSLRDTNKTSVAADTETSNTDCNNNISNNENSRKENSNNQDTTLNNEPPVNVVHGNEKSTNKDSNGKERPLNENSNSNQASNSQNKSTINEVPNVNLNPFNKNVNNTDLNANIKVQRNEPTVTASTSPPQAVNNSVKSEKNFGGSFSPSGWVQYGTRLLNRTDKICFTGEMDDKLQTDIEKLGGQITNDPTDATVLVADKFRRTFKFMCAICRSIPIVSTKWLTDSIAKDDFVNPYDHILKDEVAEKNYGFQLEESLMKAKKKPLLRDYTVLITQNVNRPSVNELKTIVKLAGGRALVRAPKYWGPKSLIISCPDDSLKVRKILEKKPQDILCPVVSADFILSSLLQQDLQINTQNLKVENPS